MMRHGPPSITGDASTTSVSAVREIRLGVLCGLIVGLPLALLTYAFTITLLT